MKVAFLTETYYKGKWSQDFNNIRIMQTHIFPYKIEEYKQYKYVKKDYFEAMPEDVFKCLESKAGWHLCITCTK